ncbi:MAG: DsrE family protein [Pseudomonadota bacterium]
MAERLSVLLLDGSFERAHYALSMASTAAALDRPATLFVTLAATRALLSEDSKGRPGWAGLPVSPELGGPDATDGAALDARNQARGVAGFEELLQACVALGVEVMVCEMGLRALGLEARSLRSDVPFRAGGLATLLGQGGQIVVL